MNQNTDFYGYKLFFETLTNPSLILNEDFKVINKNESFKTFFPQLNSINYFEDIINSDFIASKNFTFDDLVAELNYNNKTKGIFWYKDSYETLLPKEFVLSKLSLDSIEHYSLTFNDFSIIKDMDFYTHYDSLTKLPNRKGIIQRINTLIEDNIPFKIVLTDLDGFKFINDYHGQQLGDHILSSFSEILKSTLNFGTFIGRLSGDEFIIIYEDSVALNFLPTELENLKNSLKSPIIIDDNDINLSVSIGVSSFPNYGKTWSSLMSSVDYASTLAKKIEGTSIVYYGDIHQEKHLGKIQLINKLKKAIKKELFELYYQPIYNNSKQLIKVEALIRWQDKDGTFIPPMEFIPIAEESGLISEIGLIVGKKALSDLDELKKLGFDDIKISVNCSLRDFEEKFFKKNSLIDLFLENKQYSKNIILEITEGLFMKEHINYFEQLTELKEAGFEIALDDFGTGYSSLSYLTKLPLDLIKIDKSFILSLNNEASLEIVKIIINMAKILNLEIVAEGVEEAWHFDLLKKLSCDCFQGFYLNKPMPFESLKEILLNNPEFV